VTSSSLRMGIERTWKIGLGDEVGRRCGRGSYVVLFS
jgi:hypothetical protein